MLGRFKQEWSVVKQNPDEKAVFQSFSESSQIAAHMRGMQETEAKSVTKFLPLWDGTQGPEYIFDPAAMVAFNSLNGTQPPKGNHNEDRFVKNSAPQRCSANPPFCHC